MKNQSEPTEQSPDDNQTDKLPPWMPYKTVFSAEEQARLNKIYADVEKAAIAQEEFEQQIGARLQAVYNDQIRRVSQKKGFDLNYALHQAWSERIEILLRKENLWSEKDDDLKKQLSKNA